MPATKPPLLKHLQAVLEAFGGDVVAAEQALREMAASQKRSGVDRSGASVVVSLQGVNREYKLGANKVGAVRNVSMEIRQGEFVAITGPSGSGKSTLLNLVGGLDRPDSGDVIVDGHELRKLSDPALSRFRNATVGFVFQFFYLQPFLTVRNNLAVPGMFARMPRVERDGRIAELAEAVGLSDRLEHLPKELSGGQMQRAAIARALLNRPKLILADEPTGNVDRVNAMAIIDLFAKVRDAYETTVVMVTHDPEVAARADRIVALRDGSLV